MKKFVWIFQCGLLQPVNLLKSVKYIWLPKSNKIRTETFTHPFLGPLIKSLPIILKQFSCFSIYIVSVGWGANDGKNCTFTWYIFEKTHSIFSSRLRINFAFVHQLSRAFIDSFTKIRQLIRKFQEPRGIASKRVNTSSNILYVCT